MGHGFPLLMFKIYEHLLIYGNVFPYEKQGLHQRQNDANIPVAPFKRSISGQSPSFKEIDNGQM
jgi:hypothetical protein